jgi:branched-chain amino acid transport system ATP-binding protein
METFAHLAASKAMTILLVEQRIKAALDFAESVVILERGRVAWQGTPAALAAQPETVDRLLGVGH